MAKVALITGISGQDGAYLAKLLLEKGYEVVGAARRNSGHVPARLEILGIAEDVRIKAFELNEFSNILRLMDEVKPDEIYNLAAQSFVGTSFEQPLYTAETDALGTMRILEAVRSSGVQSRFYQASTSEMFGNAQEIPQRESTPFYPRSPYGVAKLFAHWATVNYRESFGLHASCGILFNHESPLRSREFVTRKITVGLAEFKHGLRDRLRLGNLSAQRDWGFAGDYVEAMWLMLQKEAPDDYVVGTGECYSVRQFAEHAATAIGIDLEWQGEGLQEVAIDRKSGNRVIEVDPSFFRPAEVDLLKSDPAKARAHLNWKPRVTLQELAVMMAESDERRIKDGSNIPVF